MGFKSLVGPVGGISSAISIEKFVDFVGDSLAEAAKMAANRTGRGEDRRYHNTTGK